MSDHYKEAKAILRIVERIYPEPPAHEALATAQVYATLAVADQLRAMNEAAKQAPRMDIDAFNAILRQLTQEETTDE